MASTWVIRTNQKVSGWSHGRLRQYITYKAERVGIEVVLQDERYTTQTCPVCGQRKKPSGRIYRARLAVACFIGTS